MTPAAFDYLRAESLAQALEALAARGGEATVLAGGQSLVPMLAMRLARPSRIVDIGGLRGLDSIEVAGGVVRLGALVRHRVLERDATVARHLPLLATAAGWVATPAIRNAGTLGGALALGDPAAEYPAVAVALGARLRLVSLAGERWAAASDFFHGAMETDIRPGELLVSAEFPAAAPGDGHGFAEIAERRGDYALAGAALSRRGGAVRIALFGVADATLSCEAAARVLSDEPPAAWDDALLEAVCAAVLDEIAPQAADPLRARLAGVAVLRAARDFLGREPPARRAA
ncbi:FAD binding domain-containing protein [Roseicyclus sp.]|uniref:FAD binding domain-containing protein n=1 Tax=Roseicyclus sp. TaxID=1914329 RepID=UPI003F9F2FEF